MASLLRWLVAALETHDASGLPAKPVVPIDGCRAPCRRLTSFAPGDGLALDELSLQPKVKNLINGKFVESKTTKWIPVHDPVRNSSAKLIASESGYDAAPFALLRMVILASLRQNVCRRQMKWYA